MSLVRTNNLQNIYATSTATNPTPIARYKLNDNGLDSSGTRNLYATYSAFSYNNATLSSVSDNFSYSYIKFTSGTGSFNFTNTTVCDILVVGGGGSGGVRHGGGGGAGAMIYLTNQTLNAGTYTITVGEGGAGGSTAGGTGNNGSDSYIQISSSDIYRAKGGGAGGASGGIGVAGGSSGGTVGGIQTVSSAPLATNFPAGTYGNYGGKGSASGSESYWAGGGGGGAGSVGVDSTTTSAPVAGNGGAGMACSITGAIVYYAGGGGGGCASTSTSAGVGGSGGGGAGSKGAVTATSGTANFGGGGGGSGFVDISNGANGAGGSGVVIVRFSNSNNNSSSANALTIANNLKPGLQTIIFNNLLYYKYSFTNNATLTTLPLTICFWFYFINYNIQQNIISAKAADADSGARWTIYIDTTPKIYFKLSDGTTTYSCDSGTISPYTWYHISITANSSSFVIYINGLSKTPITNATGITSYLVTGNLFIGGDLNYKCLSGTSIYDVQIYNQTLLTLRQISQLANINYNNINTGIGVTNPLYTLDILGDINYTNDIYIKGQKLTASTVAAPQGPTGLLGPSGPSGPSGPAGAQGPQGFSGSNGQNGANANPGTGYAGTIGYVMFDSGAASIISYSGNGNIYFYVSGATAYMTQYAGSGGWNTSDSRIKDNIKDITPQSLNNFLKLKTKEFKIRKEKYDIINYGFIAQDTSNIFSNLVENDNEGFIANIYKEALISSNIITFDYDITNELKINDKIKIILDRKTSNVINILEGENAKYESTINSIKDIISSNQILLSNPLNTNNSNIFVFGKLVNDFHTLDTNSIFSLNVEMTQQLYNSNIANTEAIKHLTSNIENQNNIINEYLMLDAYIERLALLEAKII